MTMTKRLMSLLLCLVMLLTSLVACGTSDTDQTDEENVDKGAFIRMYLTDEVFDFDPMYAYNNESALKVISLLYEPLFTLEKNGKVKNALAKKYTITRDDNAKEYKMLITLNETYWSDGTVVTADDAVYAWKRILEVEANSDAAALLYDIKNARAVKEGEVSVDDLGIYAVDDSVLEIEFERDIDYDQFLVNLTSYALVPLREDIVSRNDDWSKKPATISCSGPFTIRAVSYEDENKGLTLERNAYYYRDRLKDALDKYVTPYRLIVDYTMSADEIMAAYNNGELFYVGEIPFSVRADYAGKADITDALSTHVYYLNENAIIDDGTLKTETVITTDADGKEVKTEVTTGGTKLFANAAVREALSLAIDREAIANAVVFAKAATALVPPAAMEQYSTKKMFRKIGGDLLATSANVAEAKSKLSAAGIDATKYTFSIAVREGDEAHVAIAEMVCEAWKSLGFNVSVKEVGVIVNDDVNIATDEVAKDIRDDIYNETLYRINGLDYEVIALDYFALNGGAYSMLAPFAKGYTGQAVDMNTLDYAIPVHQTGYNNPEYDALIEKYYETGDATLLHQAEELLMKDLPVIPIIFNQNATLTSKDLKNVQANFYCVGYFKKTSLKNYEKYTETSAQ